MIWVIYLVALIVAISVILFVNTKKQKSTTIPSYDAPTRVDLKDFDYGSQEVAVILFSSASCDSCAEVLSKISALESNKVFVCNIEYTQNKDLHKKYAIEAVPTVILCDPDGVTQKAFLGSVTATDLWAAVASIRGSEVQQCSNH